MELVSVIVPIYNVEQYLKECIDSILSQTYRNLEIILVDDGSPDRCGEICDEYAEKDSRIRVIHQENKGLVGARNAGLREAHGTYVSFIDSDDAVSPVFYETLVQVIERENADVVGCEYSKKFEKLDREYSKEYSVYIAENTEDMLALLVTAPSVRQISWTGCYVWNKLYRKDRIIEEFRPECLMCEDLRFNYDYIQHCNKFVTVSLALNFYRSNVHSICHLYRSNYRQKLKYGISNANLWQMISEDKFNNQEINNYLKARAVYTAHGAVWRIYAAGKQKEYRDYLKNARKVIRRGLGDFLNDKESYGGKIRLSVWMYTHMFPIWCSIAFVLGRYISVRQ